MKGPIKLLTLFLAIICTGCSVKMPYTVDVYSIDYSAYARQGIFITESNSVSFEYTPLGSISVKLVSGYATSSQEILLSYEDIYSNRRTEKSKKWKNASVDDAIALAVEQLKDMNGNGIINLHITPVTEIEDKVTRSGIMVTGMAIKKTF